MIPRNAQPAGDLNPALVKLALAGFVLFVVGIYLIPHRNTYTGLVEATLLLPGLALALSHGGRGLFRQVWREFLPLWALLAYALVRILTDYGFEHSSYFTYVIEPAIFSVALVLLVAADRERFESLLFWCCLAVAVLSLVQSVFWYTVFQYPLSDLLVRAGVMEVLTPVVQLSGFRNPLETGMIVVLVYSLLLGFLVRERPSTRVRCLIWFGIVALLVFVALLQRRTGYVAVFGVSLLAALMVRGRIAGMALAVVVAGGITLWLIFPEAYTNRGLSYRPAEWLNALQGSVERPLLGHGFGEDVLTYADGELVGIHAHNMHLGTLYSLGLLGLVFWLWVWVPGAVRALSGGVSRDKLVYILPLFAGMIYGCFELGGVFSRINEHWFITWLPVALLLSYRALDTVAAGAASPEQQWLVAGNEQPGVAQ